MDPEPYRPRTLVDLGLIKENGWRVKAYGLAYEDKGPDATFLKAGVNRAMEALPLPATGGNRYGVGFLGAHQGKDGHLVFVSWWANENELHHRAFTSTLEEPTELTATPPDGPIACCWDLGVLAHEREAWIRNVLEPESGPDMEAYLEDRLEGSL